MSKKWRVDLHTHTSYSGHAKFSIEDYIKIAHRQKLDVVAVTDHNEIKGAFEMAEKADFKVVIGEEVSTREGEVIGLFLKEKIEPGQKAAETMEQIHAQGGLTYVCHPFDRLRRAAMELPTIKQNLSKIDLFEVFNSRTIYASDDKKAESFAKEYGLTKMAGSDGHSRYELGNAGLIIEPFEGAEDFLEKVKRAEIFGRYSSIWVHVLTKWYKWRQKF